VIELTDFERLVLRQLDGERDGTGVLDALVAAVLAGQFPLTMNGARKLPPASRMARR
jgi:hypothetical protein